VLAATRAPLKSHARCLPSAPAIAAPPSPLYREASRRAAITYPTTHAGMKAA
jgi:hypothetical protein